MRRVGQFYAIRIQYSTQDLMEYKTNLEICADSSVFSDTKELKIMSFQREQKCYTERVN